MLQYGIVKGCTVVAGFILETDHILYIKSKITNI